MNILFRPQINPYVESFQFHFEGEIITVTQGEEKDIFDFSEIPDGMVDGVETTLLVNPIIRARRENGVLYVELKKLYEDEVPIDEQFPEWMEV